MSNSARPNLFLVGAPKSGTTAMNDYLAAHPDVFMARKELHHFGSDLAFRPRARCEDRDDYLAEFLPWNGERIVGEASVWYLLSARAAVEIAEFAPDARILVMLRDPVEMLYSNYYQFLFNQNEDLPTFTEALDAEDDRQRGVRVPPSAILPESLQYRRTAHYADQLRRYFAAFGRERVRVVLFDDLRADVAAVYRGTLEFLNVDPTFAPDFEVVNSNKVHRSSAVSHLLRNPPGWYRSLVKAGRRVVPAGLREHVNTRVVPAVQDWNTVYASRPPLDPAVRTRLAEHFRPKLDELSELLDRDLAHWCRA